MKVGDNCKLLTKKKSDFKTKTSLIYPNGAHFNKETFFLNKQLPGLDEMQLWHVMESGLLLKEEA